jgi:hypothetical protein
VILPLRTCKLYTFYRLSTIDPPYFIIANRISLGVWWEVARTVNGWKGQVVLKSIDTKSDFALNTTVFDLRRRERNVEDEQ